MSHLKRQHRVSDVALAGAFVLCIFVSQPGSAQFGRLKDAVKKKIEDKTIAKTDSAIDRAMDGKKGQAGTASVASTAPTTRREWANYDFVPGARAIFYTDFSDEQVGNFPRQLELQSGQGEIVELDGGIRALKATSPTEIVVPLGEALPQKFTIEVDVINRQDKAVGAQTFELAGGRNLNDGRYTQIAWGDQGLWADGGGVSRLSVAPKEEDVQRYLGRPASFRMLGDGKALKLYVDEKRLANLPNASFLRGPALVLRLEARDDAKEAVYVTRIRVAESQKDIYDELSTSGRWTTQGILFDTGKSEIEPQSTPTLKSIAATLKAHPDLAIEVQGHTDDVGTAASNLKLSQARADAVRQTLVSDYGVPATQLKAKGYGDTKPIASNSTPEGRANNRRVVLVKQ